MNDDEVSASQAPQSSPSELEEIRIARLGAYYSALASAWIDNKMEIDRQILTLSSVGVGGLVALASSLSSEIQFMLWVLACFSFCTAIGIALKIFALNPKMIDRLFNGEPENPGLLPQLDITLMVVFMFGVLMTFLLTICQQADLIL